VSLRTTSRLGLASAALLVLAVAGGAQNQPASPLESLQLLPPVLLKGEGGGRWANGCGTTGTSPSRSCPSPFRPTICGRWRDATG
jgi:hypothetical protein